MFMLVTPLTDQLKTLLCPLVMVAGVAVKLAMLGSCMRLLPVGFPAVPQPRLMASSNAEKTAHAARVIKKGRLRTGLAGREHEFMTDLDFINCSGGKVCGSGCR